MQRHGALEEAAGGVVAGPFLHAGDDAEVHAAGEVLLGGGDDDALDRRVGERGVDGGVELGDAGLGQHVHRAVGQVPGDGGDALGVGGEAEFCHGEVLFTASAAAAAD